MSTVTDSERPTWNVVVTRARWTLAVLIATTAVALILYCRLSTNLGHRGAQYLTIGVWQVAAIAIPGFIVVDFVLNVVRGMKIGRRRGRRATLLFIGVTALSDALLLGLAFASGVAVLILAR